MGKRTKQVYWETKKKTYNFFHLGDITTAPEKELLGFLRQVDGSELKYVQVLIYRELNRRYVKHASILIIIVAVITSAAQIISYIFG